MKQPTDDTPSVSPCGLPAPSEREPGWLYQSPDCSRKSRVAGDCHRPYEGSEIFTFHHSSDDTPSVSPSGCRLPQRGSREGAFHSTECSLKSWVSGDFHRPYGTLMILAFTIHRTTLPQSALRAASSLREGAGRGRVPFTVPPGNRKIAGDFHRPYETQRVLHFSQTVGVGTLNSSCRS